MPQSIANPDLPPGPSGKYPAKAHCRRVAQWIAENGGPTSGVIYLEGTGTAMTEDDDQATHFRQRRHFYYLTGCDLPDCFFAYDIAADRSTLYIPPVDPEYVMWAGMPLLPDDALKLYDIDAVLTSDELKSGEDLVQMLQKQQTVVMAIKDRADMALFHSEKLKRFNPLINQSERLRRAIEACRVVKDEHEIAMIRHANIVSSYAHERILASVKSATNEQELNAVFVMHCHANGCKEQAYGCICASGTNASTLHYHHNDIPLDKQLNLLIDAGCEYRCYCSDITRSFPLNGKFTTESRQTYDLVLEMQTKCMALIKAGVLWEDVHMLGHRTAAEGLQALGILKKDLSLQQIMDSRVTCRFFPHGLGHYLGMDTHDVGGNANYEDEDEYFRYLRIRGQLPAGSVVTNEPGIYFREYPFRAELKDGKWEGIVDQTVLEKYWEVGGVRIEDDILVLEGGCENLTTIKSSVDYIEAAVGKDAPSTIILSSAVTSSTQSITQNVSFYLVFTVNACSRHSLNPWKERFRLCELGLQYGHTLGDIQHPANICAAFRSSSDPDHGLYSDICRTATSRYTSHLCLSSGWQRILPAKFGWIFRCNETLAKGAIERPSCFQVQVLATRSLSQTALRTKSRACQSYLDEGFAQDFPVDLPGFEGFKHGLLDGVFIQQVVRKLTQGLSLITDDLVQETDACMQEYLGENQDWQTRHLKEDILDIIARLSSRVFLGKELCRDPAWLAISENYTVDSFMGANVMLLIHALVRPVFYWILPTCTRLKQEVRESRRLIHPEVERRRERAEAVLKAGEKPPRTADTVAWMVEVAQSLGREVGYVAAQLSLTIAAVHTTAETLTKCVLQICDTPEVVQPLRDEILRVLEEEGWSRVALYKMELLDSFLQEVQRTHGLTFASMNRLVKKDVILSDGTKLPAGSRILVPDGRGRDPSTFVEPKRFDVKRFLRQQPSGEGRNQFVSTTSEHLAFRLGQHACPGRFFASAELKIAMCFILLRYDLRFVPGQARPKDLAFETASMTHPRTSLQIRRRQEEINPFNR